jgi:uncharacterized membrane protein YbhN (UPF0104 family)
VSATTEARTSPPLVVLEQRPDRIRSSIDAVRLGALGLSALVLAGFASVADATSEAANEDLAQALKGLPDLLVNALNLAGSVGALAVPLALVVRQVFRGQSRRVMEALLAGVLAIGAAIALNIAIDHAPDTALYRALTLTGPHGTTLPIDPYLAAWLALGAMSGVSAERLWRNVFIGSIGLYALAAFIATQASLLSLVASMLLGVTVGVAVRYVFGTVNERPDGARICAVLAERGLPVRRIEQMPVDRGTHRRYRAVGVGGPSMYIDVLDRDDIAAGWFYRFYRSLRVQPEVASTPDLNIERMAERRALLALAGTRVGARLPTLLAGLPCGPDTIVLAYELHETTTLTKLDHPPSEGQVRQIWESVQRLHAARISHHRLTAGRIRVDVYGNVLLPILEDGTAFASDLRIALDRAQLLATCAQLIGAKDTVRIARQIIGDEALTATVPVLQPVALSRETRQWIKQHSSLIDDLRTEIEGQSGPVTPELSRLERFRPRTVVTLVALIVASWLLIGQLGTLDLATVFRTAQWGWVPALVAASVLTYFAAGVALIGCVREYLPLMRTVVAQLAGSFIAFVLPPAVGAPAVNVRYLRKAGLTTTSAALSVGLGQVVNGLMHVVLLIVFAAAAGTATEHRLPIPGWAFIVVGALAGLAALTMALPTPRRWVLARVIPPIREALPRMLELLARPVKLVQVVGGSVSLTLAYIAALWFAVHAFNGHVDAVAVGVVYLAGGALGSLAPTPGGLGAVEAALSTGLVAAGMPTAAAVSAVLLYRVATFWLPVPSGWLAMQWLQRRDAV